MVRSGSRIDAYQSADGAKWTAMGSDAIPMAASVYVGIATTSHHPTTATDAVVDNLSIRGLSGAVAVPSGPATGVIFQASPDHASLVTSYELRVFASGADPATATPVATSNLAKPTPAANGDITVDRSAFFGGLAAGRYLAAVRAIGSGGASANATVVFTR